MVVSILRDIRGNNSIKLKTRSLQRTRALRSHARVPKIAKRLNVLMGIVKPPEANSSNISSTSGSDEKKSDDRRSVAESLKERLSMRDETRLFFFGSFRHILH